MWKYEKGWVVNEAENVAFDFGPSSVEIRVGEKVLKLPVRLEQTAEGNGTECIVYIAGAQWSPPHEAEPVEEALLQKLKLSLREAYFFEDSSCNELTIISGARSH